MNLKQNTPSSRAGGGLPFYSVAHNAMQICAQHKLVVATAGVIVVAAILETVPYQCGVRVRGEVIVDAVSFTTSKPLNQSLVFNFWPAEVTISGATSITPWSEASRLPNGVGSAVLGATVLQISNIAAATGATIGLRRFPNGRMQVQIKKAVAAIKFEVSGTASLKPDRADRRIDKLEFPGIVSATLSASFGRSMVVSGKAFAIPNIKAIDVSSLSFSEDVTVGENQQIFTSSIRSGKLQIVDTDCNEEFEIGSELRLSGFTGTILRIERSDDGLLVAFSGRARNVAIGPVGHTESITPKILEYMYHQQWLVIMWTGVVACLGVIGQLRQWWDEKNK